MGTTWNYRCLRHQPSLFIGRGVPASTQYFSLPAPALWTYVCLYCVVLVVVSTIGLEWATQHRWKNRRVRCPPARKAAISAAPSTAWQSLPMPLPRWRIATHILGLANHLRIVDAQGPVLTIMRRTAGDHPPVDCHRCAPSYPTVFWPWSRR